VIDEAIIVLAEAVFLAGLLILASRLWLFHGDPYPMLVAKAVNATASDAETMIVLPKPVHCEAWKVCYAGQCYPASLSGFTGSSWNYVIVDRGYGVGG
jgi:hypothetical protein